MPLDGEEDSEVRKAIDAAVATAKADIVDAVMRELGHKPKVDFVAAARAVAAGISRASDRSGNTRFKAS